MRTISLWRSGSALVALLIFAGSVMIGCSSYTTKRDKTAKGAGVGAAPRRCRTT